MNHGVKNTCQKNEVKDIMNKRGKIIILCLLICIIFSLQSVCAADNAGNTINTTINNDLLSIPASNEGVIGAGGGSFAELNTTINGNSDSVVNLNQNYTYNSGETAFTNGIVINRAVTINGNGYAIDGANAAKIFDIQSGGVILNNIVFINGHSSSNGGAIEWASNAENGLITNCIFTSNTADDCGGALFWRGHDGKILNSKFTGNKALGTAGTALDSGDGGAIEWIGYNGYVKNCTFTGNDAAVRGGAVFLENNTELSCDNTTFENCTFIANHAGTNGGAVDWHEGAHDGKISVCIFKDNTANANGGAVYWRGHNGEITNSNFTNNIAKGLNKGRYGNVGDGGAVFWAGMNGTVTNSRFINNKATMNNNYRTGSGRGGAVYLEPCAHGCDNTSFHNCVFEDNVADTNGGAINWHKGASNGLVEDSTFINNTAKRNGGAIFWNGVNGTVKNSKFDNNRATGESYQYDMTVHMGDKIIVETNGTLVLGNIIVIQSDNLPRTTPISSDQNKLFVLNYTTNSNGKKIHAFESWVAHDNGGSLEWLQLDNTTVDIDTISPVDWAIDQFFGGDGGTILWQGNVGLVKNCTFIESNSARRGGGAYMTGCDNVTYESCNFTYCTSGTNGC